MIYLDSSVALAGLLLDLRSPPEQLWQQQLVSSRLLEYQVWTRPHAYGLAGSVEDQARLLLLRRRHGRDVEIGAGEGPGAASYRSLHLATMDFLHRRGDPVELASYDARFIAAVRALGMPVAGL